MVLVLNPLTARGRFRPKAKPRPIRETTVSVVVIDKDNKLLDPVGSSVSALEVVRTVEQLKENESSEHALHSEVTASNGCGDLHSSFQKAVVKVKEKYFSQFLLPFLPPVFLDKLCIFRMQMYFLVWNVSMISKVNLPMEQVRSTDF